MEAQRVDTDVDDPETQYPYHPFSLTIPGLLVSLIRRTAGEDPPYRCPKEHSKMFLTLESGSQEPSESPTQNSFRQGVVFNVGLDTPEGTFHSVNPKRRDWDGDKEEGRQESGTPDDQMGVTSSSRKGMVAKRGEGEGFKRGLRRKG